MIPYSMPLWTIFTKWPAPLGPQWSHPSSAGVGSAPLPALGAGRGADAGGERLEHRLQPG